MRLNIALTIVALVLILPCWMTIQAERVPELDTKELPKLFPGFSSDLVSIIQIARRKSEEEIQKGGLEGEQQFDALVFERSGARWFLKMASASPLNANFVGLELDADRVERDLLDHVADVRVDHKTLVPEDQIDDAFRQEQRLTRETGTLIGCLRGPQTAVAELIVGKRNDQVKGYYVCRPKRTKEVVLYEPRNEYWELSLDPTHWAKKKIHQFLMSEVARFSYKNSFGEAAFEQKPGSDQTWIAIAGKCPEGVGAVRQAAVGNLIQAFLTVKAESFYRRKAPTDQSPDTTEVRVTLKGGEDFVIWIGQAAPDKSECKVVSSVHDFQFGMSSHAVNPFRDTKPVSLFDPK